MQYAHCGYYAEKNFSIFYASKWFVCGYSKVLANFKNTFLPNNDLVQINGKQHCTNRFFFVFSFVAYR